MAASCLEQRLWTRPPSLSTAAWICRFSPYIVRVSAANRAAMVLPVRSLNSYRGGWKHIFSASKPKRNPILEFDEDDENDEDSDDEDAGILDMEEWIKNKPSGFGGGGKEYDTSLEERLLEEIKRDQIAQAAAKAASKNKKPTPPIKPGKKAGSDKKPDGVEVFVGNLPKKRNVERDMRAAIRSVSGLLHIRPVVAGNEKTREPICKGLAFLTFATLDDAEEFIDRYNDESILFGKVQKKISCKLAKTSSPFKEVSRSQPSNGPRLGVRDHSSGELSSVSSATSPSSVEDAVAVGVACDVRKSTRTSPPSNSELRLDLAEVDIHEEEVDADLFVLEKQIWDELENEEDLELDMELEEDDESVYSFLEEVGSSTPSGTVVEDSKRAEEYSRTRGSGQGFGRTTSFGESRVDSTLSAKKSEGPLDEKENKIKELEAKLKDLQSQLNKVNSVNFTEKEAEVNVRELKIESLEKRLLSRAKAGLRDSNVSNGKPTSTSGKSAARNVPKNPRTAAEETSKDKRSRPPPRQKLGASSRLRKREREIFSEALAKYSAPKRD
ncbi:hypothetical protein Mapa_008635 [Marchantia paleacea]|nr:hypothetical protein Mapa_008635 [Marchantia paleacea]